MNPAAPIPWRRNLILLWSGQILAFTGYAAAIPFMPLYMKYELGIDSQQELAKALTLFHVCSTLCLGTVSPIWGWVADRFGRKLMLLRAYFCNALIFPLMGFCIPISIYATRFLGWLGLSTVVTPFAVLLCCRILASAFSGSGNAAQALIVSTTPEEHQGFALGVFSTALWSGQMTGLMVGSIVVDQFGYRVAFCVLSCTYLISGIINLFVKENFVRSIPVTKPVSSGKRWNFSGYTVSTVYMLMFIALVAMSRSMDSNYISLKVDALVGTARAIRWTAYVSAAAAAGGVIAGFTLGKLADRCRPLQLLIPVLAVSGTMLIIQGASRDIVICGVFIPGAWIMVVTRLLGFAAAGGVEPVLQMLVSRITPPERRGGVFGFATTCRMVGLTLGSLLSGAAYYGWNADMVFYCGALAYFTIIPLVVFIFPLIKRQFPESMKPGSELNCKSV